MKGYTGHPTFRKSFEHTNGMKEDTLWYMLKIKDERKNALDKIDSSSNVQNNMVNKILSYIKVLCQNKRVSGDMTTNNSFQHPMFTSSGNKIIPWENGEQMYKHGETILSYSIFMKNDEESKSINEIKLPSSSVHHLKQLED